MGLSLQRWSRAGWIPNWIPRRRAIPLTTLEEGTLNVVDSKDWLVYDSVEDRLTFEAQSLIEYADKLYSFKLTLAVTKTGSLLWLEPNSRALGLVFRTHPNTLLGIGEAGLIGLDSVWLVQQPSSFRLSLSGAETTQPVVVIRTTNPKSD